VQLTAAVAVVPPPPLPAGAMVKHDNKASPPVKVVGFRVEGATPSPGESSLAEAAQANTSTGSPSPVIIPPAFAVRNGSLDLAWLPGTASLTTCSCYGAGTAVGHGVCSLHGG
jgi:hypothetical protein